MVESLFRWLDSFKNANMVRAAFGEARKEGSRTIIPVAVVAYGAGSGSGWNPVAADDPGGGAGSVKGIARPLAVVSVGSDGVRVHEITDATTVAVSGMAMGALVWLLAYRLLRAWLARSSSPRPSS